MAQPTSSGSTFASAAPNQTVTGTLNGLFKQVFSDAGLLPLINDFAIIQKLVGELSEADKVGRYFSQPVIVASENGVTYLGSSGGVNPLVNPQSGQIQEAQVIPSEFNIRAWLAYGALSRAAEKGKRAFEKETTHVVEDLNMQARKRLEIAMLYGQKGIGTVSTSTYDGATYTNVVLTDATWAGGIWAGSEGSLLDAFNGVNRRNASDTPLQVYAVNSDTKTLSFVGDVTASIAAGDVLFYFGARVTATSVYNEMAGLQAILQNSGVLFNIDAARWSLWKGNSVSSIGTLSLAKIQTYIALAVNKGLMEKVAVFLSPKAWATLATNETALRAYDRSYTSKSAENGFEALKFHSQNGLMELYSHPMVKDGDLFIVPIDMLKRIGSVDLTFGRPGVDGEETVYFDRVPGQTALELQCYSDQAIFLPKPAHGIFGNGITY